MVDHDTLDGIRIVCPDCGTTFSAPKSLAGGVANCPECRRAVDVPGADWLFRFIVAICVLVILGFSVLIGTVSVTGGVVSLVIGLILLTLILMVM